MNLFSVLIFALLFLPIQLRAMHEHSFKEHIYRIASSTRYQSSAPKKPKLTTAQITERDKAITNQKN